MGGGWVGLHSHFRVKPNRCVVLCWGWGFDNIVRLWEAFSPVERVSKHWEYLQENVRVPVREGGSGGVKDGKYDVSTRDNSGYCGN